MILNAILTNNDSGLYFILSRSFNCDNNYIRTPENAYKTIARNAFVKKNNYRLTKMICNRNSLALVQ